MAIWIKRVILIFLTLWAVLTLALVAVVTFGPITSVATLVNSIFGSGVASPDETTMQQTLRVPDGFTVGQYASGLPNVRMMEFSRGGDLLVSQPREGKVLLLKRDRNHDGRHDGVAVLLEQLTRPHGLALHNNWLYVAESNAIGRVAFNHETGELTGSYTRIIPDLPDNGNHWTKSIRIHHDALYLSMGSTCNVCEEKDARRATIMRFDLEGNHGEIFATGLRNSVGMDFAPWDDSLYATDNGRDLLGDDYPVCELNRIEQHGFYGWPYINDFGDLDPDYGAGKEDLLAAAIAPVFGFQPHNAPLGIRFVRQAKMPAGYDNSALVALHGSWNRSTADGYKVVSLHWGPDGSIRSRDFMTGFETRGNIIGRPVDIAEGPDRCLYISDDYSGTIYRVCYGQPQQPLAQPRATPLPDTEWQRLSAAEIEESQHQGEALYALHACSTCHQLNGDGNPSGQALQQLHQRYTLARLRDYFLTPNPPMPQYELTPRQRHDLAVYLLSQE